MIFNSIFVLDSGCLTYQVHNRLSQKEKKNFLNFKLNENYDDNKNALPNSRLNVKIRECNSNSIYLIPCVERVRIC